MLRRHRNITITLHKCSKFRLAKGNAWKLVLAILSQRLCICYFFFQLNASPVAEDPTKSANLMEREQDAFVLMGMFAKEDTALVSTSKVIKPNYNWNRRLYLYVCVHKN